MGYKKNNPVKTLTKNGKSGLDIKFEWVSRMSLIPATKSDTFHKVK